MPKERFYHIRAKKQNEIKQAILKQLKSIPLEKFSAKKLTSELELAQGSFYGYFFGIDDMVEYALEDYIIEERKIFQEWVEKLQNEKFTGFTDLLNRITLYAKEYEYLDIMKNLTHGLKLSVNSSFEVLAKKKDEIYSILFPILTKKMKEIQVNFEMNEKSETVLKDAIELGIQAYRRIMLQIYNNYDNKKEYIEHFDCKINLLIQGVISVLTKNDDDVLSTKI